MTKTNIAVTLICALTLSVGSIFVYDKYFAQKLVVFDLKGYITKQRKLYAAGDINEEQLKEGIKKTAGFIEKLPQNKVVLTSDVVLKGAEIVEP